MRINFIFLSLLFLSITSINAASLKNLSEKLSSQKEIDNTKERIPLTEEVAIDENVNELDKLKRHRENEVAFNFVENLEDSLRKLHNNHNHHWQHEKLQPITTTDTSTTTTTTAKEKDNFEIIPWSDEVTTTTTSNQPRKNPLKNDLTFNPSVMLRQMNGKYSAYDMSQYIYWTGDEEGVAKAIEELIDENLMSRENAIEFLNDVRTGIDYLENLYNAKEGDDDSKINTLLRSTSLPPPTYNYQKFHSLFRNAAYKVDKVNYEDEMPTLSPAAFKALEKIPALMKLAEHHKINNFNVRRDPIEDEAGRSRLSEFISAEYSLEEVIYQLAKTMFSQSLLTHSNESQLALQKLTEFLESEGKRGKISPALQKKILDVLLAALSDTLNENPEIMAKARHAMTKTTK